ncbi:hypothetical protein BOTBODRAFT_56625 [Botryobasidium botryosum FD-172 SS1]|uniref:Ricin B lectin domain-containing protein n=1 Tax=Botryobasidium botryosum (strain FD-172 SS1) TaxID=930990 RepID=A0A067M9V4_BOTB1|nr:hypothetical protein BOTBODRAFT_56625 [Botryobasidium botryosum FD-172 SS1]
MPLVLTPGKYAISSSFGDNLVSFRGGTHDDSPAFLLSPSEGKAEWIVDVSPDNKVTLKNTAGYYLGVNTELCDGAPAAASASPFQWEIEPSQDNTFTLSIQGEEGETLYFSPSRLLFHPPRTSARRDSRAGKGRYWTFRQLPGTV